MTSIQVNEAFKDLSQIVEGQGELLNQIEVNVVAAHDSTEKGVGFLEVSVHARDAAFSTGGACPHRSHFLSLILLTVVTFSRLFYSCVQQAAKYQKKYRKWLLFFLAFIILTASGICIYFFAVKK